MLGACEEKRTLVHLWWESEWCSHHGKQYGGSSEKLNTELPYNPAISFLSIHPKDVKTGSQRGICTPLFTAELFIMAKKGGSNPSAHQWKTGKTSGVYAYNGMLVTLLKKGSYGTCYNMDEY